MMCDNCKRLADWMKAADWNPFAIPNNHLNGGRTGTGIKCQHPETCTCQHRPPGAWRNM